MISLHIAHAPGHVHHTTYVRTVDSDIVVLVISMLLLNTSTLRALGVFRKWGKLRNIPIHDTCFYLGPSRYLTLPIFHAIN